MDILASRSDAATKALTEYGAAHVVMASAAERVVAMVAAHVFTPGEAIESLAMFASQYRDKLRALDAKAGT
jgi:hypothetical protein